jgi:hypothetical protein
MPLARYFLVVGGILLALLFISNAVLPDLPMAERLESDKPVIRIHSDQKWPERVVIDTTIPTIVPQTEPHTRVAAQWSPPAAAGALGKTGSGNAHAQLSPAREATLLELKRPDVKPQRKRKIAKRRGVPPMMMVEQDPRSGFGFFGNRFW